MRSRALLAVLCLSFCVVVFAEEMTPHYRAEAWGTKSFPAAPRIDVSGLPPLATLGAADSRLLALSTPATPGPVRNGFERRFTEPVTVTFAVDAADGSAASQRPGKVTRLPRGTTWSGRFAIDADRVRLRLSDVRLPPGAVLWIYSDLDAPIAFDRTLLDSESGLWTPSVRGGTVHLEVELPPGDTDLATASFTIGSVMHIFAPDESEPPLKNDQPSCLQDVQCKATNTFAAFDSLKRATAHLQYVKNGSSYVCTGGLLNDTGSTGTPYLLTANHCFDSQSSASSLEAFWDWRFASCVSTTVPSLSTVPRSTGATLLATSAGSDFTMVRLNSIPSGRSFMGWTTVAQSNGTPIYRVSHPAPDYYGFTLPQMYSVTNINTSFGQCAGRTRPSFIYSTGGEGGVYGGSSGSLVTLANGMIVGQLFGSCGPSPADGCNQANATVDGSFATTYASISQYLGGGSTSGCTPTSTSMCLNGGRFRIEATYATSSGESGAGKAVKLTDDSGYLWFFSDTNIEVVVKVLDACVFGRFWVFAGGLTNVNVVLTITDTKTGGVRQYTNPQGLAFQPIQDTNAFATCP